MKYYRSSHAYYERPFSPVHVAKPRHKQTPNTPPKQVHRAYQTDFPGRLADEVESINPVVKSVSGCCVDTNYWWVIRVLAHDSMVAFLWRLYYVGVTNVIRPEFQIGQGIENVAVWHVAHRESKDSYNLKYAYIISWDEIKLPSPPEFFKASSKVRTCFF